MKDGSFGLLKQMIQNPRRVISLASIHHQVFDNTNLMCEKPGDSGIPSNAQKLASSSYYVLQFRFNRKQEVSQAAGSV